MLVLHVEHIFYRMEMRIGMKISRFVNQIEAFDVPLKGSFLESVCFASVPIYLYIRRGLCICKQVSNLSVIFQWILTYKTNQVKCVKDIMNRNRSSTHYQSFSSKANGIRRFVIVMRKR